MDFETLKSTVYNPAAIQDLFRQIFVQSPSKFKAQESYDAMEPLTWGFPFALTVGYVVMVFGGSAVMGSAKPFNMKSAVTFWNFLLAAFSIAGAIITVPYSLEKLAGNLTSAGFKDYLCDPGVGVYDGVPGYWVFVFILSKTPELLDTFFLVFQKKPVIFLHWYHHFTVMLFSWQAWKSGSSAGLFYASMNFTVHALMYSYYFLMCFKVGRNIVKPLAPFITSLQIVQMVGGIIISTYSIMALNEKGEANCKGLEKLNVQLGMGMYISYFLLFTQLFKKMYIDGGKKKSASAAASEGGRVARSSSSRK